jgi:PmbA protein
MDYQQLVEKVVADAVKDGVEVEAYLNIGQETNILVDRGKVEKLSNAGQKGLGVRILVDGRQGYAYTSDLSEASVERIWKAATKLVEVSDGDEYRQLPPFENVPDVDLEIHDPMISKTPLEEKIKFARQVEQAAMDVDDRVMATNRCTYIDRVSSVFLANSNGFSGAYDRTVAVSYLMAIGRDDSESTMGLGFGVSSFLDDLDPKVIGEEAGNIAVSLLGGKPVPTQEATVVFSPNVGAQLIAFIARALSADAMQKGRSFLLGKMGESIASDIVGIVDNGLLPRGISSAPFDGEGVPRRATRLIDEGILQSVLHNSYTARKADVSSTGNAARSSHRSPAILAPSNFYLQPGTTSPDDVIAGVNKGLYVLNTMSVGGIDPVSGDYSAAARGIWIENGELQGPVNEVTIAAPMSQMLQSISAVGRDLRIVPTFGAIGSPTIRIDRMTIGGR